MEQRTQREEKVTPSLARVIPSGTLQPLLPSWNPLGPPPRTTPPRPSASSFLPEPIFMSPLCWMKMVSLVRLPWMMGGSQECRKLGEHTAALSTSPAPGPARSPTADSASDGKLT